MLYSQVMRVHRIATGISILALTASAQQKPAIVGGISSTAPIEIDVGTAMEPAPVVASSLMGDVDLAFDVRKKPGFDPDA